MYSCGSMSIATHVTTFHFERLQKRAPNKGFLAIGAKARLSQNPDVRRKKYMNNPFRFMCALVFLAISPNIYAAEALSNAPPEIINRAEGWVIATSRAEATDRYAVILKGNGDFSNWRVIPATAETRLSKEILGEACVISGTIETTSRDQLRRIRISESEELTW